MTESSKLEKHDCQNWLFLPQKTPVEENANLDLRALLPASSFTSFKSFGSLRKPVYMIKGDTLSLVEEGTTKTTVVPLSLDVRPDFMWWTSIKKIAPDKGMVASSTASVSSTRKHARQGEANLLEKKDSHFFQGLHPRLDTTKQSKKWPWGHQHVFLWH